jgi:hypothetical protein
VFQRIKMLFLRRIEHSLGANKPKMFDSDSYLYHANSQELSIFNPSNYNLHLVHYITAGPARKYCTSGRYRTLDFVCKGCPFGTWSKDAATICCPDGQYEGSNGICEKCPPGKSLTWIKGRSSEKNKCRPCGKGKITVNNSQFR